MAACKKQYRRHVHINSIAIAAARNNRNNDKSPRGALGNIICAGIASIKHAAREKKKKKKKNARHQTYGIRDSRIH